jgi:hypothetical protein
LFNHKGLATMLITIDNVLTAEELAQGRQLLAEAHGPAA